jgi:hypothetical protein
MPRQRKQAAPRDGEHMAGWMSRRWRTDPSPLRSGTRWQKTCRTLERVGMPRLLAAAQRVLAAVADHVPEVGSVIGVDVVGLSAANVRLHDITAEGHGAIGLRARDVTVSGDFEAGRIRVADRTSAPDPPAR